MISELQSLISLAERLSATDAPASCLDVALHFERACFEIDTGGTPVPNIVSGVCVVDAVMMIPGSKLVLKNVVRPVVKEIDEDFVEFNVYDDCQYLLEPVQRSKRPTEGYLHSMVRLTLDIEGKRRVILVEANRGQFKHIERHLEARVFVSPRELNKVGGWIRPEPSDA